MGTVVLSFLFMYATYKLIFIQICFVFWSHPVVTQSLLQICSTGLQYFFFVFIFLKVV